MKKKTNRSVYLKKLKNKNGAASDGIGLVANQMAKLSLKDIKPVNKRIVVASFEGNPEITLVITCTCRGK